jgi:hypothetical protein
MNRIYLRLENLGTFGGVLSYCKGMSSHEQVALLPGNVTDTSRLILIELPRRSGWPRAKFPDSESALPFDLAYIDRSLLKPTMTETLEGARLTTNQRGHIFGFRRQAQAVELFEKLLRIMDHNSERKAKLLEFRELDKEAQTFMTLVIHESGKGNSNFRSGVEATIMRYITQILREDISIH